MNVKLCYKTRALCLLLFCFLCGYNLLAQESKGDFLVSGIVKDANGIPIPSVNVQEKGTTRGTISDENGKFKLTVSSKTAVLQFTSIGFNSITKSVNNDSNLQITMTDESQVLKDVVVLGYSSQVKKDITGSVSVIKADELQKVQASNFGQQLQGKTAGVTVQNTGSPSAGTSIRIRGVGSINDNGPLYVIDGVSTRNQDLSSINPNDIESISVLKDASSASIYGAQASNGVIIITTKKGKKGDGRAKLTYETYTGMRTPGKFYDMLDTEEYADYVWQRQLNDISLRNKKDQFGNTLQPSHQQFGTGPKPTIPQYVIPTGYTGNNPGVYSASNPIARTSSGTDWWDAVTQTGQTQSHQLSVIGAGESGRFALGAGYYDEKGIILGEFFKRYSFRANSEFNVRKYFRVGENLSITYSQSSYRGNQDEGSVLAESYRMVPFVPVYDIMGNFSGSAAKDAGNGKNPVAQAANAQDDRDNKVRVLGNFYSEIDFFKDLTFKTNIGIDYNNSYGYWMNKISPWESEPTKDNTFHERYENSLRWVFTNTLSYKHTFAEKHSLKAVLGTETMKDNIGRKGEASRQGLFLPDDVNTWYLNNGTSNVKNQSEPLGMYAIQSLFGRFDYSYNDKYLLTASIRRDGSSRFEGDNRYGNFPSISAGWRVSKENFMKSVSFISDMKLRVGYGETGNTEIPRAFNYTNEYKQSLSNSYDFGGTSNSTVSGFLLDKYGNKLTQWETSQMTNFGLDMAFLDNKLDFSLEYYIKKTQGMLVRDNYQAFAGGNWESPPFINVGDMKNTGIDFATNYRGGKRDGFNYDIGGTLSAYRNEILNLKDGDPSYRLWGAGSRIGDLTVTQAGQPISMFYGYKIDGIFQNTAEVLAAPDQSKFGMDKNNPITSVGKYKYADVNGDGKVDENDQTIIGNPHPDFTYGINLSASYKNFDFNLYFYGEQGKDIFNAVKYFTDFNSFVGGKSHAALYNSWTPERGTSATLPILDEGDKSSDLYSNSYYVENGSFLKLKNVTLGYTLPKINGISLDRLRFYIQATNLFTITKYSGLDPEVPNAVRTLNGGGDLSKGVDFGTMPITSQFLLGLSATF
jgi:TonB-linked SusC/RagA family outer membrane protein